MIAQELAQANRRLGVEIAAAEGEINLLAEEKTFACKHADALSVRLAECSEISAAFLEAYWKLSETEGPQKLTYEHSCLAFGVERCMLNVKFDIWMSLAGCNTRSQRECARLFVCAPG